MKPHKNEMLMIYNSDRLQDRKAYAYALSLPKSRLRPIDLANHELTPRQIKELAMLADCEVDDFLDPSIEVSMDENDQLITLCSNKDAWITPISLTISWSELHGTSVSHIARELPFK